MITCPQHGNRWITPEGQTCTKCREQHMGERVGKRRPQKQDHPLRWDYDAAVTSHVMPHNIEECKRFFEQIAADPIKRAQLSLMVRRPAGVSKERFNIAVRAAGREPMLNADRRSIVFGLDYNQSGAHLGAKALPKMGVAERLQVKPKSLKVAKYGRNSAYWGQREWLIFALKYSRGYVVRTDAGDESKAFPTVGQLKDAIRQSGWEIVA